MFDDESFAIAKAETETLEIQKDSASSVSDEKSHQSVSILITGASQASDNTLINNRPSTLQSTSDGQPSRLWPSVSSQDDCSLHELPSPISRHGSLVGDPQLPVPAEFLDVSMNKSSSN